MLQSHAELEKSVLTLLKQRNLQSPAPFVAKVLQLFETLNVRFGVMLVGPTGSGKSEVHKTLQVKHVEVLLRAVCSVTLLPFADALRRGAAQVHGAHCRAP